ncbi:unnamed protein product, partial [Laminaria digitata]
VNTGDSLGVGEGDAAVDSAARGGWSEAVGEEVDPDVVAKAEADREVQEFREKIRRRRQQQQQQQQQQKHNPFGQQSPPAEAAATRSAAPDGAGPTVLTSPTAG